jgi:hypothetical protein
MSVVDVSMTHPSGVANWAAAATTDGAAAARRDREKRRTGRCKSTCMNSMQTGIMPCATFRTGQFQQCSSHSLEDYPRRTSGHWCSQKLTVMPSASAQSGSTTMEVPG